MGSFLTDVQAAFGLSEAESDDFVAMIADEVGAFLDDARSVLDGNESPQLEADEAE